MAIGHLRVQRLEQLLAHFSSSLSTPSLLAPTITVLFSMIQIKKKVAFRTVY